MSFSQNTFVCLYIFVYLYIDNATFFLDEGFARSSRSLIHLCWSLFFIEVVVLEACNFIKRDSYTGVVLGILRNF